MNTKLVMAVALLLGIGVGVAPADAAQTSSVAGTAGNFLATVTVDAHNTGRGTAATGWFHSQGNLLAFGTGALPGVLGILGSFDFQGPVTCLDVEGNRAGLIYTIADATGPLVASAKGQAIYVSIVDNGANGSTEVGFLGPAPLNSVTTCPPTVTFLTASFGRVSITDGP